MKEYIISYTAKVQIKVKASNDNSALNKAQKITLETLTKQGVFILRPSDEGIHINDLSEK